jgi:hypothetical protein
MKRAMRFEAWLAFAFLRITQRMKCVRSIQQVVHDIRMRRPAAPLRTNIHAA